ncbi:MAG: putative transcriptional regulator, TetR family [Gammaproteobacteria bacterium]|jgi:AcrR family transcriptional regulator|nr:putative transcriptional regulator, TetR family [Gammaproteobacteria bacterium]
MSKTKEVQKEYTADKILKAACKVFPEHGFAGASISMLAKEADINQSLIYHHFGNKEELWKATKAYLLRDIFSQVPKSYENTSLVDFIQHAVQSRFEWYQAHPEIIRMINWQRLEPKRKQLQGTAPVVIDTWARIVPRMQKEGKIRNDISAEMVIVLMTNMVVSPLLDDNKFLQSKEECKKYLELVTKALIDMLKP